MVSTPLTSVNLLRNDIGEAAADIVRAAEQHGKIQTLCGIKPDQKEAAFSRMGLKAADAVLLAYDIKVNTPLTTLNIASNGIGGVTGYIKKAEITGSNFKKGAIVTYKGSSAWIVFEEEDRDGELKLQDLSGIHALAAALPK